MASSKAPSRRRSTAHSAIAAQIRSEIAQRAYPDGVALPTESEIGAAHGVSRQTVRRAFQDLVAEGVVYRIPGRGTFAVNDGGKFLRSSESIDDLLSLSLDTEMEMLDAPRLCIDLAAAGRLRLGSDEVVALRFRRFHESRPYCVTSAALPPDLGRRVSASKELPPPGERRRMTVLGVVQARHGHPIVGADQSVTAEIATAEVAAAIDCNPGDPVLRIDRVYFDRERRLMELAVNFFHPARYSYRCQLRSHES